MDVRWKYGIFLGRSLSSDQNILALSDGTITRARAMTRIISSMRWDPDRRLRLTTTPCNERLNVLDSIEAEENPHDHPSTEQPNDDPDPNRAKRRLKIDLADLGRYGYSRNCLKCRLYSQNRHAEARRAHHSEECRSRIYARMKDANAPKYLQAE